MPSASSGYTAKEQSVGGLLANVAYLEAKEVNLPVFSIAAYSRSISAAASRMARGLTGVALPPLVGEGGSDHQPIEIRRGWASLAFGSVRVSTPSSSWALIRSWSILLDSVKDRV